jgi:NADH:ubiquinone oxidoreductase subunit E
MSEQSSTNQNNNDVLLARVRQIAADYKRKGGSLIQVLHAVQTVYGYLPLEVQKVVAVEMECPLSIVSGVVTFYSFFSTEPQGKHNIRICLGTACYVRGGVRIVDELERVLGCKTGHTTADRIFTLEIARCIGACGLAPAISIDDKVYANVTPDQIPQILAPYYKKEEEAEA